MSTPWFEGREECPACTSGSFRTIYQSPYDAPPLKDYLTEFYSQQGFVEFEFLEGADYILCECDACDLVFQKGIPNAALMERLYEHWIDPKKAIQRHQKEDDLSYHSYCAQEVMQIISHLGKEPSSLRFLDFGMGWGKWALMAKAFGCDSYGTELSRERTEFAESNGIKAVSWEEIPHYRFDCIHTEQVFEHLPEPLQALRHLKRAMKANGILKISVPTAVDIKRRLKIMDWKSPRDSKDSLNPVSPLEHINCFQRKSLMKMAVEAGMKEVVIPMRLQYAHTTNWSGLRKIASNLLLPIRRNVVKKQNYVFLRVD